MPTWGFDWCDDHLSTQPGFKGGEQNKAKSPAPLASSEANSWLAPGLLIADEHHSGGFPKRLGWLFYHSSLLQRYARIVETIAITVLEN
jgi:hypothetical protein